MTTERFPVKLTIITIMLLGLVPVCSGLLLAGEKQPPRKQRDDSHGTDTLACYSISEIVVTAKRAVVPVEILPFSVSLIEGADMEISTAHSCTGIAGTLPGVFIQRTGDFGRSDVNIRGLGSRGRKSQVLIDGKPENMGLFGCTVTHSFLLHGVQRVEVIRGPSSTMYGSGAMGGVLNVIPKRTTSAIDLDLRTAGGSDRTAVTSGRLGFSGGDLFGSVSIDYRESDGHTANSSYRGSDIIARGGIYLGDNSEITVSGKIFDGFKQEPAMISSSAISESWNDYRRGSADVQFKSEGNSLWYSARYYRNFGEHIFSDGWHSTDATDGVLLHLAGKVLPWMEISGGADYRYQQGELPGLSGSSWNKYDWGVYSGVEINPVNRLSASISARYNRDEVSGEEISPSVGLTVPLWRGAVLRTLASHGFRSPQINELYMFPPSSDELEAESIWNYEAGIRQRISPALRADLTVFRIDGENFIETVPSSSPPPMYIFDNTGELRFNGMEFAISGNWNNSLTGSLSASILDPGYDTRGRPGSKFDLSLRWNTGVSTLKLSGQRVDDYFAADYRQNRIPPYNIFNLYADLEISSGITAFVSVENLFDKDYAVFTDLPGGSAGLYGMPGRKFLAGFRYGIERKRTASQ
jgi:outer membrane receptor protein involved in Fe transport